ncbi:threonine/homoserine/homoserine lactone efflux protein [Sinobacterium caligoides]|uniref:Threonine/homoserine/homoserine lactone efflux protein n=1 Tax=Sinobacterium caligoides TaxID=933926 RepID=A0A3N2E0M6_9GAMM|nr:LysE family translocator [Sinobacterium caligoides]ROS05654.1 threonine/homoserine/homoserine lactone efflux protein [Sinobacterium caligoides]
MFGVTDLWLFIVSGLAFSMIPGPDSLYVVGRSASLGFRAGSVASFGIGSGTCIHILAAAFGLSALLSASAMAFTVVKLIGCAYLLYIGLTMIFSKGDRAENKPVVSSNPSLLKVYSRGFLTNTLNPKVALFFLAFVPQFIPAAAPNKMLAFIFLGLIYNMIAMLWCHFLAWSSSSIGGRLKDNKKLTKIFTRLTGSLFLFFGVKLALSK